MQIKPLSAALIASSLVLLVTAGCGNKDADEGTATPGATGAAGGAVPPAAAGTDPRGQEYVRRAMPQGGVPGAGSGGGAAAPSSPPGPGGGGAR
jgi:hypothetical protein